MTEPAHGGRYDSSCAFCAIVRREQPAAVVYEDDLTMAFLDITAVTEGHTLVIPKRHAKDIWEIVESDMAAVARTVHQIARTIGDVLEPDGITLFQANGAAGWQDVFHLHVHVVPRSEGDDLRRPWKAAPVDLAVLEPVRLLLSRGCDTREPPRESM